MLHSREVAQKEACPHKHEGHSSAPPTLYAPNLWQSHLSGPWRRSDCSREHLATLSGHKKHRLCAGLATLPRYERYKDANMRTTHATRASLHARTQSWRVLYNMRWTALGIRHAAHARHEGCKGAHNRHEARQYHRFTAVLPVEVLCLPDEVLRHSMAGSYLLLYCLVQCLGWQPGSWGGTVVQEMTHLANKPTLNCLSTCADTSVTGSFHGDSHRDFRLSGVECCLS